MVIDSTPGPKRRRTNSHASPEHSPVLTEENLPSENSSSLPVQTSPPQISTPVPEVTSNVNSSSLTASTSSQSTDPRSSPSSASSTSESTSQLTEVPSLRAFPPLNELSASVSGPNLTGYQPIPQTIIRTPAWASETPSLNLSLTSTTISSTALTQSQPTSLQAISQSMPPQPTQQTNQTPISSSFPRPSQPSFPQANIPFLPLPSNFESYLNEAIPQSTISPSGNYNLANMLQYLVHNMQYQNPGTASLMNNVPQISNAPQSQNSLAGSSGEQLTFHQL